ncbi:MAG: diguanylate cyclase, partial [Chitinivibrionales bacterium]|nr:diguanylate cyclase [Chitinivibrionales bacterium]
LVPVRVQPPQLTEVAPFQFIIEVAPTIEQAGKLAVEKGVDLILLDLSAPDGNGMSLFEQLKSVAGDTPIVVLAGIDDEAVATQAVEAGAQDYIVKGHVNNRYLAQALRYAVARQKLRERLVNAALIDELTGLYNRRGLLSLGQQQLTMANRTKRGLLLFYVDLDDMKQINDSYGHQVGDRALLDTADLFRKSFRKSDIIARIGGDEFAIMAVETAQNGREAILKRLQDNMVAFNTTEDRPYHLSLSVGIAAYDANNPSTIEAFLDQADRLMYEEKTRRKGTG